MNERPTLTLREAAIEAILIREQEMAFSTVARQIAALFTATPCPYIVSGDEGTSYSTGCEITQPDPAP
jgi:hypothetical protein